MTLDASIVKALKWHTIAAYIVSTWFTKGQKKHITNRNGTI